MLLSRPYSLCNKHLKLEVEITAIAQLVERTAFNRVVKGSSPFGGIDEDSNLPYSNDYTSRLLS